MIGTSGRRAMAGAAGGILVAAVTGAAVLAPGGSGRRPLSRPAAVATMAAPTTTVVTAPPGPPPAYIATLSAAVSYSNSPGGPPTGSLAADNPFGGKQAMAMVGPPDGSGWLHVELPVRPNGTTGWIPAAGVNVTQTSYRVSVSLASRTLTVTDAGRQILSTPVAVGAPATPTPADSTYLWELIRPDNPSGAYGPYIFGLAEFSDTYAQFNGGDAQIGVHGQDEPWSIGQAASHGCVRLPNDVITTLAGMLPLGTPVTIS